MLSRHCARVPKTLSTSFDSSLMMTWLFFLCSFNPLRRSNYYITLRVELTGIRWGTHAVVQLHGHCMFNFVCSTSVAYTESRQTDEACSVYRAVHHASSVVCHTTQPTALHLGHATAWRTMFFQLNSMLKQALKTCRLPFFVTCTVYAQRTVYAPCTFSAPCSFLRHAPFCTHYLWFHMNDEDLGRSLRST